MRILMDEALEEKTDRNESSTETISPWSDEYTIPAKRRRTVENTGSERQRTFDWSPVQFIHESVHEFLLIGSGLSFLQADGPQRSLSERHEILAECCMACILQGSHFLQICQPGKVQGKRSLSETDLPFLHYALSGVFYHARQVERGGMLAEKVLRQLADVRRTFWTAWQFVASMDSKGEDAWGSRTPLHLLSHHRMFLSASFVLKLGFDIDAQDGRGDSALHCAARGEIVETAQFLTGDQVGNGLRAANVNLENKCGETALHLAVKYEEVAMVHLLLRHGANTGIQNKGGDAAIHIALGTTGCSIVQMLVKYGADVHLRNRTGEMAVHIASRIPNVSILESPIQQDGDINAKDRRGMTPIHHRIKKNLGMRPLVRLGANVRAQCFDGKTALHVFMEVGSCDHDGFNAFGHAQDLMFIKDSHGMTALHYAAEKTSAAMVRRLLLLVPEESKRSRLLSSQDRFGQTALHFAARRDNLDIFRVLFESGADLKLRDRNGIKPVDHAADKVSREPSLERQLFLLGYRRILRHQNGRMVSGLTK
ncbi:ankyrin repeat-containing domain protein [Colletotrichum navitas]|uniref:Ankyrin repeat-containing domain protein n=1 Tax=Colletotrichum navitas TaxID=681940 RepID=A0AAD8VBN1_9PEZI|nr:ankyrin repeat-containing domain protein [Colletotrichum navitas]KAK1599181.1 ankyrin repeat-containing domain protein [Colletotrichum navitas]